MEYNIRHCAKRNGFENIKTALAAEDAPNLPGKSIDLIFMRNVCHHITKKREYFKKLKNTLKLNGRIAIIDYKSISGRFNFHRKFGHYAPKETLMAEMKEAGYKLIKDLDFLSEQSFMIFSLADK